MHLQEGGVQGDDHGERDGCVCFAHRAQICTYMHVWLCVSTEAITLRGHPDLPTPTTANSTEPPKCVRVSFGGALCLFGDLGDLVVSTSMAQYGAPIHVSLTKSVSAVHEQVQLVRGINATARNR